MKDNKTDQMAQEFVFGLNKQVAERHLNTYEQKQQARKERYEELAQKNEAKASSLYQEGRRALELIPFGQPILIGHHSERADRSYRARGLGKLQKSFEISDKAEYYSNKAESVGSAGISSDDPDAIDKLKIKLAKLEEQRQAYKDYNKKQKAKGEPIMEAFYLTNLGANIRTVTKRIAVLEKRATMETNPDITGPGFILRENKDENRIQFIFDGKPSEEIRTALKRGGFRWSPTNGAWQAYLTNRSRYITKDIITTHLTK